MVKAAREMNIGPCKHASLRTEAVAVGWQCICSPTENPRGIRKPAMMILKVEQFLQTPFKVRVRYSGDVGSYCGKRVWRAVRDLPQGRALC